MDIMGSDHMRGHSYRLISSSNCTEYQVIETYWGVQRGGEGKGGQERDNGRAPEEPRADHWLIRIIST